MRDAVEFGGLPRPPRWARIAAGVAVVAAVAGVVVARTGAHRAAPAAGASPAAGGGGLDGVRMPPRRPARMAGQALPHEAGLRVAVGGRDPGWLRVATGRAEPFRGLPRRADGYRLLRVAAGWVVLPFPGAAGSCSGCAPRPAPAYFVADRSRVARRLGTADFAAPAATAAAVWLVSYPAGARVSAAAGTAREYAVSGAALGPRLRLPAGYVIAQGTRSGLLLAPAPGRKAGARYELWTPGTGRVSRRFADVIAAGPGAIAWVPACTVRCVVRVANLDGGPGAVIALPGRSRCAAGAFSPGGGSLALLVTAQTGPGGRAATTGLAVADVPTGKLTVLPGTRVGAGIGVDFGWQGAGGDHGAQLVADVGLQSAWQVAVWRPGDGSLRVAITWAPPGSWPVVGQGPY